MFNALSNPDYLLLLLFADKWFVIALVFAIAMQSYFSHSYASDPYFQKVHFRCGMTFVMVYFTVNILVSQMVAVGAYEPYLIGSEFYNQLKTNREGLVALASEHFPDRQTSDPSTKIANLMFYNFFENFYPFLLVFLVIFTLGVYTYNWPYPRWHKNRGIEVVADKIPQFHNLWLRRLIIRNTFVHSISISITLSIFDITTILAKVREDAPSIAGRSYIEPISFDMRFIIALLITLGVCSWSIGALLNLIYRMRYGDLHGYRHGELMHLVYRFRGLEARRRPRIRDDLDPPLDV